MCAARNISVALALLFSLDAKFVINFEKNSPYFNIRPNNSQYLSNRITISRYRERDLNRKWVILNCFFSHRSYLIEKVNRL